SERMATAHRGAGAEPLRLRRRVPCPVREDAAMSRPSGTSDARTTANAPASEAKKAKAARKVRAAESADAAAAGATTVAPVRPAEVPAETEPATPMPTETPGAGTPAPGIEPAGAAAEVTATTRVLTFAGSMIAGLWNM